MNLTENFRKNLKEADDEIIKELQRKCKVVKEVLSHYGTTPSVDWSYDPAYEDASYSINIISSGKFKPDKLSRYDNEIDFYGSLYLDDNLNFVKTDIKTSSGPNVLNSDFISALNALYSYVESNGDHWNA